MPLGTPQTRSVLPSSDWFTFFEAVSQAMELHIQISGPPGEDKPVLVREFPKLREGRFDTKYDVIVFHIVNCQISGMDPSGDARIPKGLIMREQIKDPVNAGYHQQTYSWWETMIAQFTIYSEANDRAEELAIWFHRMMIKYTNVYKFFKARGIQDLRFEQRLEDKTTNQYGQELTQKALQYKVRLELLDVYSTKTLEDIRLIIKANPEDDISHSTYPNTI